MLVAKALFVYTDMARCHFPSSGQLALLRSGVVHEDHRDDIIRGKPERTILHDYAIDRQRAPWSERYTRRSCDT